MSSATWTPDALSSELQPYRGRVWRVVEAQHRVSTLKLVDTLDEQQLLEDLLERTKPVVPPECRGLDYLLSTPFRYGGVYPTGSRFRRAGRTPGVFYASEHPDTAIAELAFGRLLFFAESPGTPWPQNPGEYTAFSADVSTSAALDLLAPPLSDHRASWTALDDYTATQSLADTARTDGAQLIRYASVRDPKGRANVAVLGCEAFASPKPRERRTWRVRLGASGVQALCEFPRSSLGFDRLAFADDPRFADFVWDR